MDFGWAWLGLELLKHIGLTELFERLMTSGREDVPGPLMSAVLVIARLCEPSCELQNAEHFYKDTVLWKTLAQMCKAAGLGDEPRRVFAELAKIRVVDVILPTRSGHSIRRRCVSQPSDHQAILLRRLGLNLPKNLPLDGKFLKAM